MEKGNQAVKDITVTGVWSDPSEPTGEVGVERRLTEGWVSRTNMVDWGGGTHSTTLALKCGRPDDVHVQHETSSVNRISRQLQTLGPSQVDGFSYMNDPHGVGPLSRGKT